MTELIQRSPEWYAARCGSLGASQVADVIARTKSGWGASRANRRASIIVERLTGIPEETYQSAAMIRGIEREPQAIAAYEFMTDATVMPVGLIRHPSIANSHASPDGMIGDDGVLEVKCPQPKAHLETLEGRAIPAKYITQIHWQMACTERRWCDYVSFNPDFPGDLQLFIHRVERDEKQIAELEKLVAEFLAEVDEATAKLSGLRKAA